MALTTLPTAPSADVIVLGLGAMGSHALWRLAARGVDVLGVEQFVPGHDRGGSHGQSRIIRTAYAEGAGYVPLAREAWRLWRELEHASGTALLTRTGCLSIGPAGSRKTTAPLASARTHNLACELLPAVELKARFPQFAVHDDHAAVYDPDAGHLHPERAIAAAVAAARAHGARVLTGTAVAALTPDPVRPSVLLADGRRLTARRIVVAAGAWLRGLVPAVGRHLRIERRVVGWFPITHDPAPYLDDAMPVFTGGDGTGARSWYGFPSLDGETVKLGLHRWPEIAEPVDLRRGHRPPDAADAARFAQAIPLALTGVDPIPSRMQTCMYDLTPDEHFVLGPHRDAPGLILLGGFSGHGFKFAPVIGDITTDLATAGTTPHPIAAFNPHRFP
ncbi:N-methyl-L-tryptophan oxidase [Uniformispora flossi]|uniref:N-methyl-L-tryptophan oxidase n=1 Tax=Uniformispora flossi TaxID=3390723 RepID=UPI003C2F296B